MSMSMARPTRGPKARPAHGVEAEEPIIKPGQDKQRMHFIVEPARSSRSRCRRCRDKIDRGEARIGMVAEHRFATSKDVAYDTTWWFHMPCFFERQLHARFATQKVFEAEDLEGFNDLPPEMRREVKGDFADFRERYAEREQRRRERLQGKGGRKGSSGLTSDEEEKEEEEGGAEIREETESREWERRQRAK